MIYDTTTIHRLVDTMRQQGLVMNVDLHLRLCVAYARLGLDAEFFDEVSQFVAAHDSQSTTQSLAQRLHTMDMLCMSLPSLRKVARASKRPRTFAFNCFIVIEFFSILF